MKVNVIVVEAAAEIIKKIKHRRSLVVALVFSL